MTIRVCICDDDPVFLDLLSDYIGKEADLEVVGVSGTKADLMELLRTAAIDVLLLDMNLSGDYQGGLNVALESQWLGFDLKIIILSSFDLEEVVLQAMTFGRVVNYITKEYYSDIPEAIRQAHTKKSGIHHSSARKLVNQLINTQEQQLKSQITKLQVQVLRLLSEGYDRSQIADELFYTEQSINNEIFKVSKLLKGKFPYLEWLRLKKQNTSEIVDLAKKLNIIP
ncbi:DNA-binding response regulator [Paenibacillus baekrokdamisoli]|uniref:DNA-binding response regulator n=1 Tax=Paenibacillus baekrokdamisoli TaxID=1712516 RepID=A0A3G9JH45_9BACL|nr:response regulator transcription factor [Paenibacillus baekrokdamisoli]MBB3068536.1 DNA-binding NarL/FixJ family response regulator [Paenibacillus baekrokdamisoli]BBH22424.1 DNA-binding response regulator [Paenibacillus baekrokdamisoli]